ncbi:PREDICTED: protein CHROMATIN REMODELING 5 [Camelina sativa]|uniref:Protein CHROMATIN REMODELING 5 n=1 Tax=Camelina sativa TaxID=90675 RepID=A0ABM0TCU2_CAMSA|nr:PREDICTED: protein CHROMATIN REMODELING 5 [Camelina sativa]
MAFFRNYSNDTVSHNVVDENEEPQNAATFQTSPLNEDVDGTYSERGFDMNMDVRYQSDPEPGCSIRQQNQTAIDDVAGPVDSHYQPSARRMGVTGRWGSTFWKDCQPMGQREGSDPAKDSQSGYKEAYHSEDNLSNERSEKLDSENENDEDTEMNKHQSGQADVPADEMLSDEYYEQDEDNQSDHVHYKGYSNPTNSRSLPKTGSAIHSNSRASRAIHRNIHYSNSNHEHNGDADIDYEEEEDEDDPEDADFEPYDAVDDGGARKKHGQGWDVSDEDPESDDDIDLSDYEDDYGTKKPKVRQQSKGFRKSSSGLERKSSHASNRQKRKTSYQDDGSEEDSDNNNDEGFRSLARRGTTLRQNNGRSTNNIGQSSEVRSSTRSVRKVSYVESEDSEDMDDGRNRKNQKDDIEEEDPDVIEKVLWHQPKGMGEDAHTNNKSTVPVLVSQLFDTESDWNEMEFLIKWKGQSHLHCQWKTLSDLQNLSGYKKVLNYTKKVTEEIRYRTALSREEIEVNDVSKEMDLDIIKQNSQVERIIADRISKDGLGDVVPEYLVKWQGLSYAEATWEKDVDIAFAQVAIDEYKAREVSIAVQGKMVEQQRTKGKASLRKLDEQPEWLSGGTLRDYQLEGLNFLVNSWLNDTNVILADEMGLGKTVQSVSMLGFLQNTQQIPGPFLVVVPLSTLANWAKEFRKWLPGMNIIVYVGTRASREVCQQYEFYNEKKVGRPIKFNALLTTYEVVLKDKAFLSKIKWIYLMVDEAHRLKNSEAQLYTALLEFSTKNKLLITGTPLQNSVEELWALLHFLDPGKFKNKDEFVENYKNLSSFNESELANLHLELRPHILRRVIKDVEKSLPPKIERILRVEMSPLQKQYYKWILERNFRDLNKGVRGNQVSLLNIVVELKKCCNHPFLFESADHGYGGDINDNSKLDKIILSSGKLVILDKLLVRLRETKHRVLIFSQMVRMLDILAEYLSLRGFQFQRLDGSTKAELRQQAMDHFNAPASDDFCFLLSTRAGGLGINLATADTVVIFDSDWNPQNDLQAMSRAHRIGQQEVVNIYRFVTSKSVEEEILERAKRKMVLDHLVIQKLNAEGRLEKRETKKGSNFDKNELSAILRFGAEELFKEEKNDEESKKRLLSMDIDEILERAEQVEEKDIGETEHELLGAFKVANFCNAEDDGSFWSRWIKPESVVTAEEALAPRAARSTKSYVDPSHPDRTSRRKKKGSEPPEHTERSQKRRKTEFFVPSTPILEGTSAQVRGWSYGNLPKRDAQRFYRTVMKFGNHNQIACIAEEVGGVVEAAPEEAQVELFDALIDGCKESVETGNFEPKELAAAGGKNTNAKASRKNSKKVKDNLINQFKAPARDRRGKSGPAISTKDGPQKTQKAEPLVKEEGEMSDDEEVYEQFKEQKWMEWCEDVLADEIKTLGRLQRLQSTSADLPKEKVLFKIRRYLEIVGRRIDEIVVEHEEDLYKQDRMTMRLWNYVSTFSNLSGDRLNQIYSKLKQEKEEEEGVGPSHLNGSSAGFGSRNFQRQQKYKTAGNSQGSQQVYKGIDTAKFEAWKRRRRTENDVQSERPPITNSNSLGILGPGPLDRSHRARQTGFPPR